jgi:pimeloyl-ACP methyl ester carboxylesterase
MDFQTITGGGLPHVVSTRGEGPDVVLVHGFPDTPYSWADAEETLVDAGFRVTVPWLRGYREDTIVPGRPYDPETVGRDGLALLDAIGATHAVVVGHDWGSVTAYASATLAPERVTAIVTLGIPHPTLLPRTPAVLWAGRHFLVNKLPWATQTARRNDFAYFDKLYRRWAPSWSGPDRDEALRRAKEALSHDATLNGAFDYYRAVSLATPRIFTQFPTVPGLIIGGTQDGNTAESFTQTADRLPAPSRAMVLDCGHWPHRELPDVVVPELLSFIEALRAN